MAQPPPPRPSGYFEKKGEVHELRQLLRGASADRDQQKKRDAIKKVIAYMTLGIDVSPLFSEMVMASATTDLVQKKMVYLYLVNYAESNSDLAILAINTLQKDCRDDDPMIRGLALRSL
ncbi:BETAA-AD, partial [Symbiodinium pilosum]